MLLKLKKAKYNFSKKPNKKTHQKGSTRGTISKY